MTKKAEIINISDDEEDVKERPQKLPKKAKVEEDCVIVETIRKPAVPPSRRLVCYGMFDCHIVIKDFSKINREMVHPNGFMSVKMKISPQESFAASRILVEFYHPSLPTGTKDVYGCLTDQVTKLLEYFLSNLMIRLDCYLSPFSSPYPVVRLIIYGDYATAIAFGNHLQAAGIRLQVPFTQPKQPYFNPHEQSSGFRQQYQQFQFQNPSNFAQNTLPEVQLKPESQITELYKSFTSPEDLEEVEQDPKLASKLFKYQKQALGWMTKRETDDDEGHLIFWKREHNAWKNQITQSITKTKPKCPLGGILADDMGLGKTIQVISLILKNYPATLTDPSKRTALQQSTREESPISFGFVPQSEKLKAFERNPSIGIIPSKATLIICPLSTVFNWEDQIYTHSRKGALKVLVYHGPNRSNNAGYIAKHDVVITTYNIIGLNFVKKGITTLHEIFWHRIVLDEAHIIKSASTVQAKSAFEFEARCRWCLTGTPLQNKLDGAFHFNLDLYSLIKFLRIEPLDKRSEWSASIIKPISMSRSPKAFAKLQILMKAIALRRVKTDVVDGKPILSLPPKTDEVRYLVMKEKERQLYNKVHNAGKAMFESLKASGTVMKNYVNILRAILMMRQACLHPSLVKYQEAHPVVEEDDIVDLDAPMSINRAESVYKVLSQTDQDVCIFCSNTVEVPGAYITPCSHLVCETCLQSYFSTISTNNGPSSSKSSSSTGRVLCPSCNIPISQKNLVEIPESAIVEKEQPDLNFDADTIGSTYPTKLEALISDLEQVRSNDATTGQRIPTKSVVFSQFTAMLNLCEKPLTEAGFKFVRLDGTMNRTSRSQALADFKSNPKVTVFLISIKSGGVGLNLVTASRAYLLEPYWNPAVEQQAIDRIHRLGQTKPVTTIRLIMKDSIEQNMQERQKYKTALAEKAMDDDGLDDNEDSSSKRKRGKLTAKEKSDIALEKLQSLMILFR